MDVKQSNVTDSKFYSNMSELSHYIGNIGLLLSQLGNELQEQAQANQPLNIHSQVKQTMDYLTNYLHNLNVDSDENYSKSFNVSLSITLNNATIIA